MKIRYQKHITRRRAQKQWNAEFDRYEIAVEVAGPTGWIRNPDQKLKPPIARSMRWSGQASRMVVQNFWPVEFFVEEEGDSRSQQRSHTGINHAGGECVPGVNFVRRLRAAFHMYSVLRAARELISLHDSLDHLKQRASQTSLKKMRVGLARPRRGSRPEGESFNQRGTSNSAMVLRRCR